MADLKKSDFYYGAALSWMINNHINPILMYNRDDRREYEFFTDNPDHKEFVLFIKCVTKNTSASWSFSNIDADIKDLICHIDNGKQVILALVCLDNLDVLAKSELVLLGTNAILKCRDKKSLTINRQKREKLYRIAMPGGRKFAETIPFDGGFEQKE